MPNKIVSKAQQRFLFATNPTLARELAGGQSFAHLPEHVADKKRKKKPARTKHASPLDPTVDLDGLVEKLALGPTLGRLPGSPRGLVRPTLKPQGLTLSGVKALTPPRLPSLSSTPPPSPLGGGQLGEQTAQSVVQTAKQNAPRPAQVRPQGLPASPVNPQGMPKVGSHGLAQRDVVASLIRGPGAGPTPPEARYTAAGCEDGQAGGAVKAGGAGGSAAPDPLANSCPLTAPPSALSNLSAHQGLRRGPALGLVKLAQPPAGSVLSPNPATSPLTGVTPPPGGSTLPQLNPHGPFGATGTPGLGLGLGSPGATFSGPSASGLFGPPPAATGGAQPAGQPQPFLHALAAGNVTLPGQPTTGGGPGHFGTGNGTIAFPPPGGGSVLADHQQRMLLYGNGPETTGPDGESLAPRTAPAAAPRRTPAPAPPPDPTSMAGRAAARAAEQRAAQPQDPVGRAIVGVVKPLVTPIELLGAREHRPDTTMDQRPADQRPVERHAPVTATPLEMGAHAAALTPPGVWGRLLGVGGRVAAPAATAESAAARAAPLLGGSRGLVTPVAETAAPAAARAAAPAAEAAAPAAARAPGVLAADAQTAGRTWFGSGATAATETAAPAAAQATSRVGTAVNAARQTGAALLDPLGSVSQGLARYGAGEGVLPALARWGGRAVSAVSAIPRYTTGSAFWGNALRGRGGMAALGGIAPVATAGLTGTGFQDALTAPLSYLGRWGRAATDLAQGNPQTAGELVADPFRRLQAHTGDPLNRVAGNAVANAENWYDPIVRPAQFLGSRFVSGLQNAFGANRHSYNDPTAAPSQAVADAVRENHTDPATGEHPLTGNPANPAFQNRATDFLPPWLGGAGGQAPEEVRRERADAHLARRAAGAPGAPAPAAPPGLDEAGMSGLVGEYADLTMRGDLEGAAAVRTRMLDAVGGDPSRLPISAAVPALTHADFPGMTPEQFGAMIDQGEGLGQGAYARYQQGLAELTRMQQALGPNPDPNSPAARAVEERRTQLAETRRRVEGRALQHYQAQVIQPMLERDVPAFNAAWQDVQARLQRGEQVDPAQVAALRDQGEQIMGAFGSHALRRAVTEGARTADGTPVRSVAEFLREASRTAPVTGPDGRPVTRVVDGPTGPVRVPVMQPASPVAQAIQTSVEQQVLRMIPGQPGVDEQGRPVTQRLVDPAVGQTIFERMDDQSRMLTYAGLGLGAIGLLGGMFGFGGAWLPLLGLLGGGIGFHQATGGDFSQLLRGDFWRGLGNGITGNRAPQDAATLQAMARPHAALGDSPMGQVSLATLQASPQFQQLVAGQLPAAETLQTIAAVRPHEREQLRQLAAQNPNVGRMIDQVNQFEAGRGQAADAAAAPPPPAPGGAPAAGGPATLRDYYATLGVTGGSPEELNRNLSAWLDRAPPERVQQAVAGMPPAVRDEAVAGLTAQVEANGGWGRVRQFAGLSGDARKALQLGRLLGVPEAQ